MANSGDSDYEVLSNCTLLMLNRWTSCQTGCWYYPADVFSKNLEIWNGIPIVFGQRHPDPVLFKTDPEAALRECGGEIIGFISDSRVVWEGHPRHVVAMNIDPVKGRKALDLYYAGRFGISGSEFFNQAEGIVTEITEASHVLVFEEDGWTMPADLGAVAAKTSSAFAFSNAPAIKEQNTPVSASLTHDLEPVFSRFFDKIKGLLTGSSEVQIASRTEDTMDNSMTETTAGPDPQVAVLNQQIGAYEQDIARLTTELESVVAENTALKTSMAELESKVKAIEKAQADAAYAAKEAEFNRFLEHQVPVGEKITEEQVAALKTAWFENPQSLLGKVYEWAEKQAKVPGRVGVKFAANTAGEEKPVRRYGNLYKRV